jgi:Tfp pilus assembly protein PilX
MRRQGGATLLIALVLMALLTLGAAATLRFSTSGLRVAVNEELRADALQKAQSLVDAVLAVPANLALTTAVDETNCVAGVEGCSHNTLVLSDASALRIFERADSSGSVRVRRLGPDASTPPRGVGYSAVRFQASFLQVESGYDGTAGGWGSAAVTEGVAVIIPQYGG